MLGSTTKLQQWEVVFNPKNSLNREGIENINPGPSNVNKSLQLVGRDDVIVGEVHETLVSSTRTVLLHMNTKPIQAEEFEKDKADPTMWTPQIHYAMTYECMYQDEVSGALWSRESINLFTCALTHTGPTTTMVICTDYKPKDNLYLYDNIIPKNDMLKQASSGLMVQLQSSRSNICVT